MNIRALLFRRDSSLHYLFLGIFIFELSPVILSILLFLVRGSIVPLAETVLSSILFLGFLFFLTVYLSLRFQYRAEHPWREIVPNGLVAGLTAYLIIGLVMAAIYLVLKGSTGFLTAADPARPVQSWAVLVIALILILAMTYLIFTAVLLLVAVFKYQIRFAQHGRLLLAMIGATFRQIAFVTPVMLAALALVAVTYLFLPRLDLYAQASFPNTFTWIFLETLIVSVLETFLIYFLLNAADLIVSQYARQANAKAILALPQPDWPAVRQSAGQQPFRQPPGSQPPVHSRRSFPWLLAVLLVIILAVSVYLSFPMRSGVLSEYNDQILILTGKGDLALELGQTDLAAINHRKAYSMILAAEGYLKGLSESPELAAASAADLDRALAYDRGNIWVYIFRGFLANQAENFPAAQAQFAIALAGEQVLPDIYFGALSCYQGLDDQKNADRMVELLIKHQFVRGSLDTAGNLSEEDLQEKLAYFETLREQEYDYLVLGALEKLKYNDAQGMFEDIRRLLESDPDNETLLYYYGVASMSWRPETANYGIANATFDRLLELSEDEDGAKYLNGYMSLLTKNYAAAVDKLAAIYRKYPGSAGFGEQYAFALLLSGQNDLAVEVTSNVLKQDAESWFSHYINALVELKSGRFADSLAEMENVMTITSRLELNRYYDQFLFSYALAYSLTTRDPVSLEALSAAGVDDLLSQYVLGATAWRDTDYATAETSLSAILDVNPDLAFAEYLLANVFYERSVFSKTDEFGKAEAHHLHSLAVIPDHVAGWFALGHNYNKWGDHELQALRAFRKVVDLVPYSDHTYDYYGMTIHAYGEIDRLKVYEQEGGAP